MSWAAIPSETLPCGCQISAPGTDPFVFIPHALDCEMYLYALQEAARQGKPVEIWRES